jgi:hypothetical protein
MRLALSSPPSTSSPDAMPIRLSKTWKKVKGVIPKIMSALPKVVLQRYFERNYAAK